MKARVLLGALACVGFAVAVVAVAVAGRSGEPRVAHAAAGSARPWCSDGMSARDARKKVGSLVWVKARITGSRLALSARGRPTSIYLGRVSRGEPRLTVVIWGRNRRNFPAPPERMFSAGRMICAHGIVTRHRGAPRIEVEFWDAAAGAATF